MKTSDVIYEGRRLNPAQQTCSDVEVLRIATTTEQLRGASRVHFDSLGVLKHFVLHSPTGFNWGYGGSGPSDLALSLLIDAFGETLTRDELRQGGKHCPECSKNDGANWREDCPLCQGAGKIESRAWKLHHDFKFAFVSGWGDIWRITQKEILEWAEAQDAVLAASREAFPSTIERGTE